MKIIELTENQKKNLRQKMLNAINDYYKDDSFIYDKFLNASNFEVEKELKAISGIKTDISYFGG